MSRQGATVVLPVNEPMVCRELPGSPGAVHSASASAPEQHVKLVLGCVVPIITSFADFYVGL